MVSQISLDQFPKSSSEPFIVSSPFDPKYDCIAWAYGDNSRCFWPEDNYYWPKDIPRESTIKAFVQLFSRIGYEVCNNGEIELV